MDGNKDTYALSTGVWNWGLDIDLGSECDISAVKLLFKEQGYPINYTLSYSSDGENWRAIATYSNDSGGEKFHNFETVKARYFRLCDNVAQVSVRQMSLCEIELYPKSLEKKYELRCFVIDSEMKVPLVNEALVLR